ncbi:hypothetical protein Droror1_Dr00025929 [Drosera rotundifolia]
MEESSKAGEAPPGWRKWNLRKSFKAAARSILTACHSKEDFFKAFPGFTTAEQERLYKLFIQVIPSLNADIEDEFESLCREIQVDRILDTVEQTMEERYLDPLYSDKTYLGELKHDMSTAKKNEIFLLEGLLIEAEGYNRRARTRIEALKKKTEENSGAVEAAKKVGLVLINDKSSEMET